MSQSTLMDSTGLWIKEKSFKKGQLVSCINKLTGLWEVFTCLADLTTSPEPCLAPTRWMHVFGEGKKGKQGSCAYRGIRGQGFFVGNTNPNTNTSTTETINNNQGDLYLNSTNGSLWIFRQSTNAWQLATPTVFRPNGTFAGQGPPTTTNTNNNTYITNDAYLDIDTGNMYKYTNTTWTQIIGGTTIKGKEGPTGYTGVDGHTGAQGTRGDTGTQGTQGTQGTTGRDGTDGQKGDTGQKGETGATGTKGATGPQGASGEAATDLGTTTTTGTTPTTATHITAVNVTLPYEGYYPGSFLTAKVINNDPNTYQIWKATSFLAKNLDPNYSNMSSEYWKTNDNASADMVSIRGYLKLSAGTYQINYSFVPSWQTDVKPYTIDGLMFSSALLQIPMDMDTDYNNNLQEVVGIEYVVPSSKVVIGNGVRTKVSLVANFNSDVKLALGFTANIKNYPITNQDGTSNVDAKYFIDLSTKIGSDEICPTISFCRLK